MTFENLQKANESIEATLLKNEKTGKEIGYYAEVNQRIKAFRMLYPEGTIKTEMLSNENGVCIFRASIIIPLLDDEGKLVDTYLLGTGHAYEKENSTFINKTSYIENCETSAVGRALAMCGIGIDKSIASAEEVINAVNNQDPTKEDAEKYVITFGKYNGKLLSEVIKDSWYKNYLLNGNDEYIKKCIELLTGEKMPSQDEQQERLELINDLNGLVELTNTDYEKLLAHYKVESNADMTTEQLKEAIEKLKEKLV
jgi:hypothetical protein